MLSKLPFDKKIFCFFIGLLITALFAAINNYYFYNNQEYSASLRQSEIARMLTRTYQKCEAYEFTQNCNQYLLELVKSSDIYGIVSIENNGEEVYKENTHKFGLSRKKFGSDFFINDDVSIYLGQLVTPPLWKSTLRSVTFSAMDWPSVIMSKQDPVIFAKFVAWPRSAPTFAAGVLVFLVVFIVRAHASALLDKNLEQRSKINNLAAELRDGEHREKFLEKERERLNKISMAEKEKREKLDFELQDVTKKYNYIDEKELDGKEKIKELEGMIEKSWEESYENEKKIKLLEEEKKKIEKDFEEKEKEIRFYQDQKEFSLSKNQKKLIASILLESPDVRKSNLFKAEPGKHHSKDYVKKISAAIERNPRSKDLVAKVFPKRYDSNKRGCCELFIEKDGESFYLDVYDVGDQGYAAKLILSGENHWQAIAETKYIINTVRFFQGMTFEDKTGL